MYRMYWIYYWYEQWSNITLLNCLQLSIRNYSTAHHNTQRAKRVGYCIDGQWSNFLCSTASSWVKIFLSCTMNSADGFTFQCCIHLEITQKFVLRILYSDHTTILPPKFFSHLMGLTLFGRALEYQTWHYHWLLQSI